MAILKQLYTITYELFIDSDAGEILETKIVNKDYKEPKPTVVVDDGEEPKLFLEENKYRLNNAAISLMNLDASSKLVIKYEDNKPKPIPVIGTNTAFGVSNGNKLSKTNTVACRGSNREELAKYGTIFSISAHPTKEGIFMLTSDNPPVEPEVLNTEEIASSLEEDNLPFDLGIDEMLENNQDINEIDSTFFKL